MIDAPADTPTRAPQTDAPGDPMSPTRTHASHAAASNASLDLDVVALDAVGLEAVGLEAVDGIDAGEVDPHGLGDEENQDARFLEAEAGVLQLASNQVLLTLSYSLANHVRQVARLEGVDPEDILIELIAEGVTKRAFEEVSRPAPSHLMTRTGYVPPEANGNRAPQPALSHHAHMVGQGVMGHKGARLGVPGPYKNGNGNSFSGNAGPAANQRVSGNRGSAHATHAGYQGGQGYQSQGNGQGNRGHAPAYQAAGQAIHASARGAMLAGNGNAAPVARGCRGVQGTQSRGRAPCVGAQGGDRFDAPRDGDAEE